MPSSHCTILAVSDKRCTIVRKTVHRNSKTVIAHLTKEGNKDERYNCLVTKDRLQQISSSVRNLEDFSKSVSTCHCLYNLPQLTNQKECTMKQEMRNISGFRHHSSRKKCRTKMKQHNDKHQLLTHCNISNNLRWTHGDATMT